MEIILVTTKNLKIAINYNFFEHLC